MRQLWARRESEISTQVGRCGKSCSMYKTSEARASRLAVFIFKPCKLFQEDQFDAARRAVALFADDDLGDVLLFGFGFVVLFAVDEHYDIGVLFETVVN